MIPRLSAAVLLRDNLLTMIRQVLRGCLDEETRVSFEILHDALRSRHVATYDMLPIIPKVRGKSAKHQIYTVLQVIERIGGYLVSGYASIAKDFVYADPIKLNSVIKIDLLWSMDNQTITAVSFDEELKLDLPITEEEAFAEVMNELRSGNVSLEISTVSALMSNIPNFDTTDPEVPGSLRFVASYMNDKSKIEDRVLDFITIDQLDASDVLVKTVLDRIEVSENSSEALRESVGILLRSFDTKPWDRRSRIGRSRRGSAMNIFDHVTLDYYPKAIVSIARFLKNQLNFEGSLNIGSTFYASDTEVTTEYLTNLRKQEELPEILSQSIEPLRSFVSQKHKEDNYFSMEQRSMGFNEALKHLRSFDAPCMPRVLREAMRSLVPLLTEDLPWSFAYGEETTANGNSWKLLVMALINLRNTPVPKDLAFAIDNFIFHAQSSGLLGKPSVLYEDGTIFQRPDSSDVELDMHSLLSRIPDVFSDNRFTPLMIFATKTNLLDYLGHRFNKFEHDEPRQLLLALLNRALAVTAVRTVKPLLTAINVAKGRMEKPLLSNIYTSEELPRILEIFPKIHEDPRYIPLKILFNKKNVFSRLSPNFDLGNLKSDLERVKIILSSVALKPIEIPLAESISFALNNLDGPPLPVRCFNRRDFEYLVDQLLSESNYSRLAILQSPVYDDVADWNLALRGSPEVILSRILNYPVEQLSKDLHLAKLVRDVEASLDEESMKVTNIPKSKTLNAIFEEFQNELEFRVIKLLFKKSQLATLVPELNTTRLDDLTPREALKELLEHLAASKYVKSEKLLSKHLVLLLRLMDSTKKSSSARGKRHESLAFWLSEMLIDPFDSKFDSLMQELKNRSYRRIAANGRLLILRRTLKNIQDKSRKSDLRRIAQLALAQVFPDEVDSKSKKQRAVEVKMISDAIDLLPKTAELDPLRELLSVDWIRGVLPAGFQVSKYQKRTDLLRAILFSAKDDHHVSGNGLILRAIYLAEQAIGVRKPADTALGRQLTSTMIRRITNLIPPGVLYEPIRSTIKSAKISKYIREIENWQRYPSVYEKLGVILAIIESTIPLDQHMERSLMELRRYLASQFDFISKVEWTMLKQELYRVSGNVDLVPLKLFFTQDNLIKYLPKGGNYTDGRLPSDAFIDILDVLREVPSLKRRGSLYHAMGNARKILIEKQLINRGGNAAKSANGRPLTAQNLRFILALKVEDAELRNFLNPKELIRLLPNDFEFSGRTTFKTKAVCLLRQLTKDSKKMSIKLQQLLRRVESLPDVPLITDKDLRPLIDLIPRDTLPSFAPISKLLHWSNLTQLFPGDFEIRSFDNSKTALREVVKMLERTIGMENKQLRRSISILRQELRKKKSNIFREQPSIDLKELQSLIEEIPFDVHVVLRELKRNFTKDKILSLLPREFEVDQFPTKKSRLMGILDAIITSSMAGELEEPIEIILNLVSAMPDAPRIHEDDITKALSSVSLNGRDSKILTDYCNIERLAARLPIVFDINRYESRKQRISVLLKHCNETRPIKKDVKKALSNAMAMAKKLPSLDLTNFEINSILDQVNCGNFSLTNPLKIYLSKTDIAPLLPWNLNLDSQSTFKLRITTLLKALLNVRHLKSGKYKKALKNFITRIKNMPDRVSITETDLTALRRLAVMQDPRSKLCTEHVTLPNVLKVVPPSFDIGKYPDDVSKLSALLRFFNDTRQIIGDQVVRDSCKFVDQTLSREVEQVIFRRLTDLANGNDEYSPLKLFLLSSEATMFDDIAVSRGYENENANDTLRVAVRHLLKTGEVMRSKTLSNSMVSLLATLPYFAITKFDVDEALAEIPKLNRYDSVRILLGCPDVKDYLRESTNLPSDCTPKRLLLWILDDLGDSSFLDRETADAVEELRNEVRREVRDQEVEEIFEPLKDRDINAAKLDIVRSFLVAEGPEKILGQNYRHQYPDKLDRLRALCKKLMVLPEETKNGQLRQSLEYLTRILENNSSIARRSRRSIDDINVKSLVAALKKTWNERMILGLVRFISDPGLLRDIKLKKNPYDYKTKGALLKAIISKGRGLRRVKRDRLQSDALEYFKDRIDLEGPGGEPIELKNYARNSNINVDTIGLLKALNSTAANATVAVKMAAFFKKDYDGLLHGVGFDQAAYVTRGPYLKAFLRHLARNSAVPDEVRLNAEILLPAVSFVGPGAESVVVNEDIVPDNRMFVDQPVPGWSPQQYSFLSGISNSAHAPGVVNDKIAEPKNAKTVALRKETGNESDLTSDAGRFSNQLSTKVEASSSRSTGGKTRRALADEDVESATFHPDVVLFEPGDRMLLGPEVGHASEDNEHIVDLEEADRASNRHRRPVTSLRVNPDELPKTLGHSKTIPHRPSKHPQVVDLVARKLFVREDDDQSNHAGRRFANRITSTAGRED